MELVNDTRFAARILKVPRGNEHFQGTLVVKSTFDRQRSGRLTPCDSQLPILDAALTTDFGIFHHDSFVAKDGVDMCVLGSIERSTPVRTVRLSLEVAAQEHTLLVHGDRRWIARGTDLVASDPEPFTSMPLNYARAYGGTTTHLHETVTFIDNPIGRGHYLSEECARGNLLPNIEAESSPPLASWSDQREVAGWGPYPMFWGIRAREGVDISDVTPESPLPRVRRRLNNHAHPALIVPSLDAAAVFRISGMRDDDVWVALPSLQLRAAARVGSQDVEVSGELDGVFIWLDAQRVTLTHRFHFAYDYRKNERRTVRLYTI